MRAATVRIPLVLMGFALASCGSDGDSMMEPEDTTNGLAPGTARVTIGSTTWTATATVCANFGGTALGFVGMTNDTPPVSITLDAIPADPTSNDARVDVSDNVSWRAGEDNVDIGATIPIVTAQNGRGTGSATFVNTLDPDGFSTGTFETASGTYEFVCP